MPQNQEHANDTTIPQAMWRGFIHGGDIFLKQLTDPIARAGAKAAGKSDADVDQANANTAMEYGQAKEKHPISTFIGDMAGSSLAAAPVVMASGAAAGLVGIGKGATIASQALKSAVQGGAAGAAMNPDYVGGSRAQNALVGAGAGAGVTGGLLGVGKALAGSVGALREGAGKVANVANELDVPVGVADLASPRASSILNSVTKYMPFSGFSSLKSQQEAALEPGIKKFISAVAAGTDGSEQAVADVIRSRADNIKGQAGQLFDDVSNTSKSLGMGNVKLNEVTNAVNELDPNTTQYTSVKRALNPITNTADDGIKTVKADLTFDEARNARSIVGKQIGQLQKQVNNGTASQTDLEGLYKVKNALTNDLDTWGLENKHPELVEQYTKARGFYQSYAQTFRNPTVAKALKDEVQMETMVNRLLTDNNSHRVQNVMNTLSNDTLKSVEGVTLPKEGIAQARAYTLQNALQNAITKTADGNKIDLGKFLGTLNTQKDQAQKVVWGEQYSKLNGLNNLLTSLEPKLSTKTGAPGMAEAVGTSAAFQGGATAAAAMTNPALLSLPVISRLFNSPKMAHIMTRWNYVTPNTPDSIKKALMHQGGEAIRRTMVTRGAVEYQNHDQSDQEYD